MHNLYNIFLLHIYFHVYTIILFLKNIYDISELRMSDEQIRNYTLFELERTLQMSRHSLKEFTKIPYPSNDFTFCRGKYYGV